MAASEIHLFAQKVEQPGAVLFACFQNAVRSPMAEALLKHLRGTAMYVDSCGVREGKLDPFAVQVLEEIGINLTHHQPKSFDQMEDGFFDLIISLSPEAHHRATELTRTMACDIEYWPILDATIIEGSRDMRLAAYRQVRDELIRRIRYRFPTHDN
ncbi:MAG: low molecular weight phosphatase family protein [Rhodospirillaceae bacterium]|nr:low molecular weight phosphatase family protein [Rhodospirillaceae bacterium]|tara:strand:- start:275 stop:742 length:468 start_codon:yes stop_codon:yes gene_type:complete